MSKNRLQVSFDENIRQAHENIINALDAEIDSIKRQIKAHISNDQLMQEKQRLIQTINGIGENSAPVIINYLHTRQFASVKQYIAYLGLCPSENNQGQALKAKED